MQTRPVERSQVRYRGQLHVDDQRAAVGLPVELVLMDTRLAVWADGETVGQYPLGETEAERIGGDRFRLDIGSESLVFVADDALGFSYDALPFIRAGGSHPTSTGLRRFAYRLLGSRRSSDPVAEQVAPGPRLAEEVAAIPTDDVAAPSDREEAEWLPPDRAPSRDEGGSDEPVAAAGVPDASPPQRPPSTDEAPSGPEEDPPATDPVRCAGTMSNGSPCPMEPGPNSSLCHTHGARLEQQRADLHRRRDEVAVGGRPSLPDLDDVLGRLEKAVAQVHDGSLAPQQALAMASLVQAMIETIELSSAQEGRSRI